MPQESRVPTLTTPAAAASRPQPGGIRRRLARWWKGGPTTVARSRFPLLPGEARTQDELGITSQLRSARGLGAVIVWKQAAPFDRGGVPCWAGSWATTLLGQFGFGDAHMICQSRILWAPSRTTKDELGLVPWPEPDDDCGTQLDDLKDEFSDWVWNLVEADPGPESEGIAQQVELTLEQNLTTRALGYGICGMLLGNLSDAEHASYRQRLLEAESNLNSIELARALLRSRAEEVDA